MPAPGMMYLGRAGPSKMIELTPWSPSLIDAEGGGEVAPGETNTEGRIGPSKMSIHSLTLSVVGELGLCAGVEGVLIPGGCGIAVDEPTGNNWACLEIEEE